MSNSLAPRYFINTWAARTGQRIAARLIDSIFGAIIVVGVVLVGPHGRPFAQCLQIVALIVVFESFLLAQRGATIGMSALGLRVSALDRAGHPTWLRAARRSFAIAWCYPIMIPGVFAVLVVPWALLLSIALSPIGRGFHDRLSRTVVVQAAAPALLTEAAMETWWDPQLNVVTSPWGRLPGLHDRRRARAHRYDNAWWMAAIIAITTLVSVGIPQVPWLWLWLLLVWLVVATIDEARWVQIRSATPGHVHAGYKIVDFATGQPPTKAQAIIRACVVTPIVCIPPLTAIGALWVHASTLHRGPHDLFARTLVVEPGYEQPEFVQRPVVSHPSAPLQSLAPWHPPAPIGVPMHQPPPPFTPGPF